MLYLDSGRYVSLHKYETWRYSRRLCWQLWLFCRLCIRARAIEFDMSIATFKLHFPHQGAANLLTWTQTEATCLSTFENRVQHATIFLLACLNFKHCIITWAHALPHLSDWRYFWLREDFVRVLLIRKSNSALKNNCFDDKWFCLTCDMGQWRESEQHFALNSNLKTY